MSCAAFTFLSVYIAVAKAGDLWQVGGTFVLGVFFFVAASYLAWRDWDIELEKAHKAIEGQRAQFDQKVAIADAIKEQTEELRKTRELNENMPRPLY